VATVFVVFMGFAFVLPFLPLYVRELGVEQDAAVALWAGVLIGTAPLVAGLVAPIWGRLADRHGQKRVALLALAAYVVFLVLSASARSPAELLGLRIGIGLFGGIGPLSLAMASAGGPKERTGQAVGSVQAAQIMAAAAGPLVGGTLADLVGIRNSFLVTAAICAAAWGLVLFGYREPSSSEPKQAPAEKGSIRAVLRLPEVLALGVVLFFVNFIGRSFTPILPLQLEGLGVPPARLAIVWAWLIGIIVDVLYGDLLGLHAMTLALAVFATARFQQRLVLFKLFQQAGFVAGAAVATELARALVRAAAVGADVSPLLLLPPLVTAAVFVLLVVAVPQQTKRFVE